MLGLPELCCSTAAATHLIDPDLDPDPHLNSWLEFGSTPSPQTSLAIWTLGKAWLPSAVLLCSPLSGAVRMGPLLAKSLPLPALSLCLDPRNPPCCSLTLGTKH